MLLTPSQRHESPVQDIINEDEEEDEDDENVQGFDARSDDVISLTDGSSPARQSERFSSEDIEVSAPSRLKRSSLHNARNALPAPRAKPKRLAAIFTNPGRQTGSSSRVTVKLKHASRSSHPKPQLRAQRTRAGPNVTVSRRQAQIRSEPFVSREA